MIHLDALEGDTDLYVCAGDDGSESKTPSVTNFTWSSTNIGGDEVVIQVTCGSPHLQIFDIYTAQ